MKKLSIKQINNLMTGTALAVEISTSSEEIKAFIVVGSYTIDERGLPDKVSKYLNDKSKGKVLFWLRKYEVKVEYIDEYISDDELESSIHIKKIESISDLEDELGKYLEDFSVLDVEWKCERPI
jgi:hypothetical protein